ncbi:hypothetical protein C0J52_15467 [Blattella germanica]|nr:hypothetical protein C0J52_15467 [Blattella germanica]
MYNVSSYELNDDEGADSLSTPSISSRVRSTGVSSSESESDSDNEICDEATNRGRHKKDFKPKREQHLGRLDVASKKTLSSQFARPSSWIRSSALSLLEPSCSPAPSRCDAKASISSKNIVDGLINPFDVSGSTTKSKSDKEPGFFKHFCTVLVVVFPTDFVKHIEVIDKTHHDTQNDSFKNSLKSAETTLNKTVSNVLNKTITKSVDNKISHTLLYSIHDVLVAEVNRCHVTVLTLVGREHQTDF